MLEIRVPATSANVGPGFDCLGFAIRLYNIFRIEKTKEGIETNVIDKTTGKIYTLPVEENLFYQAIKRLYTAVGKKLDCLRLTEVINIPIARGLGSSASAVIAGLVAGNHLLNKPLSEKEIIDFAIEIEGHPDNVLPAYKGGFIISVISDNGIVYKKLDIDTGIRFVFIIPDFKMKTKEVRKVLPENILFQDAVFNIGRTALLTASLIKKDLDMLRIALEDRLHQDYRSKLIPGFNDIIETSYKSGAYGVCLSGSGPTIMAVANNNAEKIGEAAVKEFKKYGISSTYIVKSIDNNGCKII